MHCDVCHRDNCGVTYMSALTDWLTGVVYTSVIISIFIAISDGFEMKSAIKWAAGGVMLFALLSPVTSFKSIKLDAEFFQDAESNAQDTDFENLIRSQTIITASNAIEREIGEYCKDKGINTKEIRVFLNVDEYNNATVNRIEIDLKKDIPSQAKVSVSNYVSDRYMTRGDAIIWSAGDDYER